jgi:transcription elongation factor Elf1
MMVIFGWGNDAKALSEGFFIRCPNCSNATQWQIVETSKRFSLYFVPVAKWSSQYWLVCPVCSSGIQIASRELAQEALAFASRDATTIPRHLADRLLAA